MRRLGWGLLWILGTISVQAQTSGVLPSYLAETVRRGLPLLALTDSKEKVPLWPELEAALRREASLAPSSDLSLLDSWILLQEGCTQAAFQRLETLWSSPSPTGTSRYPVTFRAEAWFSVLRQTGEDQRLNQAWTAWEQKYLSPRVLMDGLSSLEKTQPLVVPGVLRQALALYPGDRRWLSWLARYASEFPQTLALLKRDLTTGGFSSAELQAILRQNPDSRALLIQAGYPNARLEGAMALDYPSLLSQNKNDQMPNGAFTWDQNTDGIADSRVVFQTGQLKSWSRGSLDPLGQSWSLVFEENRPKLWLESNRDSRWTLAYEAYPYARTLTYEYGNHRIEYQFPPFTVDVPIGPEERFQGPQVLWPWQFDSALLPLSLSGLAAKASSILTHNNGILESIYSLYQGQVWLQVDDSNADGNPDVWSFYRQGKLDRVYRDPSGRASANLQEVYAQGELQSFLADADQIGRTTFALFPADGVELWDFKGTGKPLLHRMSWDSDSVSAIAFSGTKVPWETMPPWESRP